MSAYVAGVYTDVGEPFLGADLLMRISDTRWFFNPSLEYVFVDPGDLATVNLDVHYDLDTDNDDLYVWLGGGPAIVFRDDEGAATTRTTPTSGSTCSAARLAARSLRSLPAGEGVDRGRQRSRTGGRRSLLSVALSCAAHSESADAVSEHRRSSTPDDADQERSKMHGRPRWTSTSVAGALTGR